jgi:magnesium chelatase accessory protein
LKGLPPDWPNAAYSRVVQAMPHRWHVQQMGAGPDALLLHGAGASAHSYGPLIPHLQAQNRLFAPDLTGHGFTQSPKGRARLPNVARDLQALLAAEDISPDLVIGHSAGGAIALEMTRLGLINPRRIVVLNGALEDFKGAAGVIFPMMAKILVMNPLTGMFLSSGPQSMSQARAVIKSTGSELPDTLLKHYAHLIGRKAHVDGTLGMMAQWSLAELSSALPRIETPVLFIHGAKDSAVDVSVAKRAAKMMPNAELVVLKDAGHLAHEEAPEEVAHHIATFTAQT